MKTEHIDEVKRYMDKCEELKNAELDRRGELYRQNQRTNQQNVVATPVAQLPSASFSANFMHLTDPEQHGPQGLPSLTVSTTTGSEVPTAGTANVPRSRCQYCNYTNEVDITFTPCGHQVCCFHCSAQIEDCPLCSSHVTSKIRTYTA